MASLAQKLTDIVGDIFEQNDLPKELGEVRLSDRPDLAQFQCNGAMAAARIAKKNPREIATQIVESLSQNDIFDKVDIAGPGFINLNLTDAYIAAHLAAVADDEKCGVALTETADTVMLDYGGPNIAKPMHVGHLRASIIGDTLRRLYSFKGYKAIGDVHMGDWGTHMGMIISEYMMTGQVDRILNLDLDDDTVVDDFMNELTALYPQASAACKENEDRKAAALEAVLRMQKKEEPHISIWQKIRDASVQSMKKNFAALNVYFDLWKGEADVNDYIADMVDDLREKGLVEESDGAQVIRVEQDDDKKEMPPLILYKRDGAVMYGTTDLATIVERMKLFDPARIVYVVDQRQHLHFTQVFRAAEKSGITSPDKTVLLHAGFGTMNGPDGKPFKTRAGGVMKLEDLIETGREKARARLSEANLAADMDQDERENIANIIAVAAIKFADLQNQRITDYIFDMDRFMSFEGKTGPYLLYQIVRIKSLLRKGEQQGLDIKLADIHITHDSERALALALAEFPDAFDTALRNDMPHYLCEYVYKLAGLFSSFYGSCHILSGDDQDVQASRIALSLMTQKTIETVLELLGIDVPDRM
ncbi:MAG: arginine--tRNA ligase [Alphaproteobacteria bacterium]|jgi:arginyl-tRNA synthetase|nr:arginine--tRNA ligase [Alphaproteobacteria bacterium]MDP7223153.1 arginine--tRNA ligase [Alphaproteobacteria bacterium]